MLPPIKLMRSTPSKNTEQNKKSEVVKKSSNLSATQGLLLNLLLFS